METLRERFNQHDTLMNRAIWKAELPPGQKHLADLPADEMTQAFQFWCLAHIGQLISIDMSGIDLGGANLRELDMRGANLSRATLREADLYRTNLVGAILRDADLRGARTTYTNLTRADLTKAKTHGSWLNMANLHDAILDQCDWRER